MKTPKPIFRGVRMDDAMPADMKKGHVPKGTHVVGKWSTTGSENMDQAIRFTQQAQRQWGGSWMITRQDWQTMKVTDTGHRVGA